MFPARQMKYFAFSVDLMKYLVVVKDARVHICKNILEICVHCVVSINNNWIRINIFATHQLFAASYLRQCDYDVGIHRIFKHLSKYFEGFPYPLPCHPRPRAAIFVASATIREIQFEL